MADVKLYDFFLSYKRRDSSGFVEKLAKALHGQGYRIWIDSFEIKPGDSITASIERGLNNSLIVALILSQNYFEGWSEQERRAAFNLFVSHMRRLVPIWLGIDSQFVSQKAPLLSDLSAIVVDPTSAGAIEECSARLAALVKPGEQRDRLWQLIIARLRQKYPDDPNVALFHSVMNNDTVAVEKAAEAGANVNITDRTIVNYYQSAIVKMGLSEALAKWLILSEGHGEA